MKKIRIIQMAILISFVTIFASCSSSYPYGGTSTSLIISSGPGITPVRYYDGRYFYRSPEGFTYWRGHDNRYYIDKSDMRKVHYDKHEYGEWKKHQGNYH